MDKILTSWASLAWSLGTLAAAIVAGLIVHRIFFAVLSRIANRTSSTIDNSFVAHSRKPAALLLPLIGVILVMPLLHLQPQIHDTVNHMLGLAIIASIAWLSIAMTSVLSDVMATRYNVNVKDNLAARRVLTQVNVLRRILVVIIVIISASVMLMTFPGVRQFGQTLFASAGVAGLVLPFLE